MTKSRTTKKTRHRGMDVSDLRRPETGMALEREDLDDDPMRQFESWFREACSAALPEPNAMSIATVDADGHPCSRTVLLKYFDERGFVFFTNLESKKAAHIKGNAHVSLLFFWPELGRQVGIRGTATRVPRKETLRYFITRPRGSQIGAWVSAQSSIISSRSLLEMKFEEMKHKFADRQIPLPSFWGGFRVMPREFEFWQGRSNRLHDRFLYSKTRRGWTIERLAP